ncbi:MAG: PKD domain-containing protein [Bacteroidota bacterium]
MGNHIETITTTSSYAEFDDLPAGDYLLTVSDFSSTCYDVDVPATVKPANANITFSRDGGFCTDFLGDTLWYPITIFTDLDDIHVLTVTDVSTGLVVPETDYDHDIVGSTNVTINEIPVGEYLITMTDTIFGCTLSTTQAVQSFGDFSAELATCDGKTYDFTFESNGGGYFTAALIDFGDGNTETSSITSTPYTWTHTYATAGTNEVIVEIHSLTPCVFRDTLTINVYDGLDAGISYAPTCTGNPVVFTNPLSCDGVAINWFWDFGDGQTSTSQHPTHTYTTPGGAAPGLGPNEYLVTLTGWLPSGVETTTTVVSLLETPVATLGGGGLYCPSGPMPGLIINLTGVGPWDIVYTWDGVPATFTVPYSPFPVGLPGDGVYQITSVNGAECSTNVPSNAVSVQSSTSACSGGSSKQASNLENESKREELNAFQVYPIPTRAQVTVEAPASMEIPATGLAWTLRDLTGRPVKSFQQTTRVAQFDLSELPNGTYWLARTEIGGEIFKVVLLR